MSRLFRVAYAATCIFVSLSLFAEEKAAPAKAPSASKAAAVEAEAEDDAPEAFDGDSAKFLEKLQAEQKKAAEELQKVRETAPFQQSKTIALTSSQEHILGFCVLPSGNLAAISGLPENYGETPIPGALNRKAVENRVQWLDGEGKILNSVVLDFKPKAVNAAPDGSVFVVGQGMIARFDKAGKKLAQEASPHIAEALASREKFEEYVMERYAEEIAGLEEQVKQYEDALKELEEKPAEQRSKTEQREMINAKGLANAYGQMLKNLKSQKREQVIEKAVGQLKELHRVAVSANDVFVVTREATGYGYTVWRLNHDLKGSKKIVSKLSGCCGQMDIQIAGSGLAIAENSRHRVLLVDREGKQTTAFGQTSRIDVTKGFGGCCNPMNTCCDVGGGLLTSESNGLVKRYSMGGEFQAVVGVAKVTEGCKNSSIGISPKGDRLYYFDVEKGQILILTKSA